MMNPYSIRLGHEHGSFACDKECPCHDLEPLLKCSCGQRWGRLRTHRDDCDSKENL